MLQTLTLFDCHSLRSTVKLNIKSPKYNQLISTVISTIMATVEGLFIAIEENNQRLAINIIGQLSDDQLITKDDVGNTPLHYAVQRGHNDVVKILVDRLPDEHHIIKDKYGVTPLHTAATYGHMMLLELLLIDYLMNILL